MHLGIRNTVEIIKGKLFMNQFGSRRTPLKYLDRQNDAKYKEALNWLSDIDYWSNYETAREKRKDTPTTGNWLLTHDDYEKWIKGEVSTLWLYGIRTYQFHQGNSGY